MFSADYARTIAQDAARAAGQFQISRLEDARQIRHKGPIDIVTEVDAACERMIADALRAAFPDHDILAEEGLIARATSDYRWIVDPLDGTVNYAHRYPMFCVSIALEYRGKLLVGVIYDPNRDEMFSAVDGQGATLNGRRIRVSDVDELSNALLVTGFAYNVRSEQQRDNLDNFARFIKRAQTVRRPGSAAIDLAWVACGRAEGFWELFLHPWDTAAGVLLVRESGGRITDFHGGTFNLYGDEILASNGSVHEEMVTILSDVSS